MGIFNRGIFNKPSKNKAKISHLQNKKIFIIGFNKTGTTSLKWLFEYWGFNVGKQQYAELLSIYWYKYGDYENILKYCDSAQVFQDRPFSSQDFYKKLYNKYPDALFILTIRDSPDQWFNSLKSYHAKAVGLPSHETPKKEDLNRASYIYPGFMFDVVCGNYNHPEVPLYDKKTYLNFYTDHINKVEEYFQDKPDQLIKINVSMQEDFKKLCNFLKIKEHNLKSFPHKNKT